MRVRRNLVPGNSKSLWDAVKVASDVNVSGLPETMYQDGVELERERVASAFGDLFFNKVKNITESTQINPLVHNGHQKINIVDNDIIPITDIIECVKSLKIKNCEGYDRIPQRILSEGIEYLIEPLTGLFKLIVQQTKIPKKSSKFLADF